MKRIVKVTVGGVTKVVDLLRGYTPPASGGLGVAPLGTSALGS